MKFTKMSLVAALLVGTSAFAIDNVKVEGDAKLFYSTSSIDYHSSATSNTTLFDQPSSIGQAELGIGATSDLAKGISGGVHLTVLSTLGLENNLVGGIWAGGINTAGNTNGNNLQGSDGTNWWMDNAWLAATMSKTTVKVGRMDLDTPLAFSETWNIAKNTFEAAVVINQDLPDTTLVGAYVGGSNGANDTTVADATAGNAPFTGYTTHNDAVDALNPAGFGGAGAYAAGIVNNSVKPLVAQAWYYNVNQVATAYWLQGDVKVGNIMAGVQYANMNPEDAITLVGGGAYTAAAGANDSTAFSVMLGYEMKDVATFKAAYASTANDGLLNIQNTATGDQSKLYTEAWWNYGIVGEVGAKSYMLSATGDIKGIEVTAQYTGAKVDAAGKDSAAEFSEVALVASKSFGPLDTTLAYINTHVDNKATGATANVITGFSGNQKVDSNTVQAYLTLNF